MNNHQKTNEWITILFKNIFLLFFLLFAAVMSLYPPSFLLSRMVTLFGGNSFKKPQHLD